MSTMTLCKAALSQLRVAMAVVLLCGLSICLVHAQPAVVDVSPVRAVDQGSALSATWKQGPFMEIYVRGYQDSNGDGMGDLKGLTSRLDYLKQLGVRGLWLMPIQPSQDGDHGYSVTDYRAISADLGTMEDFDELLKQAHARNIGVIVDYVINHSAADHPLFEASRASASNPYRDWYVWENKAPAGWDIYGKNPWHTDDFGAYFAGFSDQMPDFNLKNPKVLEFHLDNLRFWLNRGVDGFRFDAVGNLIENSSLAWESQPENHLLMAEVRKVVMGYQNRFMICEAPGDAVGFAATDSCASSFAFGHNQRVVAAALGSPRAIEQVASYFRSAPVGMAGFVSNHDSFAGQRLWDRMGGDQRRYRLAAATYMLQPGPPFIYYGEEIGLAGGAGLSGDHKLRSPMSWNGSAIHAGFSTVEPFRALSANAGTQHVAAQSDDPRSLLAFYRSLIALRARHTSLGEGRYEHAQVEGWMMSFQRVAHNERTVVLINYGEKPGSTTLRGLPAGARLTRLWPVGEKHASVNHRGQSVVGVPPVSFAVFSIDPK